MGLLLDPLESLRSVTCREGEEGDNFYVIEHGLFEASKKGEVVFKYEGRGAFGELALMYNCPRAATIKVGDLTD
jgi:cAMP-dependent protein kinase regulator